MTVAGVDFVTWQFVRLMVRLEQTAGEDAARSRLLESWQADWAALDRKLEELRQDDFEAFADLMMNHEITFDEVDAQDRATLAALAAEVAGQLDDARKGASGAEAQDLTREAEEMRALAADLRRPADQPG